MNGECQLLQSLGAYGLDSQVLLGSLIKGRSSSSSLKREMQKSMCYAVGSDLYSMYMFFPSAYNPADALLRELEVPAPSLPLPAWWDSLSLGDSQQFDEWLTGLHLDTFLGRVDFLSCTARRTLTFGPRPF